MKAIVIAIGDELISGETIDTNSAYLSGRLALMGIETLAHWTVGDHCESIAAAIVEAAQRVPVVLVTGGLGPTADDVTRQAVAEALKTELVLNAHCLEAMEQYFRRLGRAMSDTNRIQAMIPASAEPLANDRGTAAGIVATCGAAKVFVLPGVPSEMRHMFAQAVAPHLPSSGPAIIQHVIHTFGAGESQIGPKVSDITDSSGPLSLGTTVEAGMVSIRITCRTLETAEAPRQVAAASEEIRRRLGELVVGENQQTMASVVGDLLRASGQTLATAESCTGGMIGQMITACPGSGDYYLGGIIAYSDQIKQQLLHVPQELLQSCGAVSEEVAAEMAGCCRRQFAGDWALAVTGIAGPTGTTAEKPLGLVYVALAGSDITEVHRHVFSGDRQIVRTRSALTALNYLRLSLIRGRQTKAP